MVTIPVRGPGGRTSAVIVDDVDADRVRSRAWRMNHNGYAQAEFYVKRVNGRDQYRKVRLHRWLLGLENGDPRQVDHRNLNRLDCRRENLRICTNAQNAQNQPKHRRWNRDGKDSGFRGVTWHSVDKKWMATAAIAGKIHRLGRFHDPVEANAVVTAFRAKHMPFSAEAAR